jgi:hypothetical protein
VKTIGSGRLRAALALLLGILLTLLVRPAAAGAEGERLVLAFYYSWFDPGSWNAGKTSDVPLSPYNSDDAAVMSRHIDEARAAGIDALVLNWWGAGNRTDSNLTALLGIAEQKGFRVAAVLDINSPFMQGTGSYIENLRRLLGDHAGRPAYLRFQGKPVVFFYNVARLPVATWQQIRSQVDPDHTAIWIAEGTNLSYQQVFDGHHLYSITWPSGGSPSGILRKWGDKVRSYNRQHGTAKLWVATVMPGYDDRGVRPKGGFAHSREGGEYFRQCWQAALDSRPDWVIVNSFNEWMEGTQIEPGRAYDTAYLDQTREWVARFKQAVWPAVPVVAAPAAPSVRPMAASHAQPSAVKVTHWLGTPLSSSKGRALPY